MAPNVSTAKYGLCLRSVEKVGKLRLTDETTRDEVIEYMHKMADAAGVVYCKPDNLEYAPDKFSACVDALANQNQQDMDGRRRDVLTRQLFSEYDHFDFLYSCQRMFNELQIVHKQGLIIDLMLARVRIVPHYDRPPEVSNESLQKYLVPSSHN